MVSVLLMAVGSFSTIGSTAMPAELRATMTKVLKCAAQKDLHCLSRYAVDPSALQATFPNGRRGWNPDLDDAVSDGVQVNLYGAAVSPTQVTYRVYRLSHDHYDIAFYRVGELPPKARWEQAGKLTSVHCEFRKTRAGWRLTDTICGYVSGD